MSTLRTRAISATAASLAALTLGACGTSFNAQTNQQYQAAEGANVRGEVNSMNTVLVADESGSAVLSAGVVNKTDDEQTITDVSIERTDGLALEVELPSDEVAIAPGKIVTVGSDEANAFTVPANAKAGEYVTVTYTFSDATETEVYAPVVARSETYESVVEAG